MKKSFFNSATVIVIVLLSIICGLVISKIVESKEKEKYPLVYSETVSALSESTKVPEYVIYSVIKVRSDFDASGVSDGLIGLYRLSPEQYNRLETEMGNTPGNPDLLYSPETNLRLGTHYLYLLFRKYASWNTVFAAFYAGEETVDGWLAASGSEVKTLNNIPDGLTAQFVSDVNEAIEKYKKLYKEMATEESVVITLTVSE